MSLPLVYRGDLVGVLNLTNKAQRGSYTAADVERVRVLAMLLALIITRHDLPARLYEALHGP
jgi:signal transduction protein with GAF and PtsI domain